MFKRARPARTIEYNEWEKEEKKINTLQPVDLELPKTPHAHSSVVSLWPEGKIH
jgi:hypothetical protein